VASTPVLIEGRGYGAHRAGTRSTAPVENPCVSRTREGNCGNTSDITARARTGGIFSAKFW
jgi:hypothetical protein